MPAVVTDATLRLGIYVPSVASSCTSYQRACPPTASVQAVLQQRQWQRSMLVSPRQRKPTLSRRQNPTQLSPPKGIRPARAARQDCRQAQTWRRRKCEYRDQNHTVRPRNHPWLALLPLLSLLEPSTLQRPRHCPHRHQRQHHDRGVVDSAVSRAHMQTIHVSMRINTCGHLIAPMHPT